METRRKLAVIGCGTMGKAIVGGLLRAGTIGPDQVFATTRRAGDAESLQDDFGISAGTDNVAACEAADVIVLTLKPQLLAAVIDSPQIAAACGSKLVISVAAGISMEQLAQHLPTSALIRAMPNTPCLIRAGMTVLARGPGVEDPQVEVAETIFKAVGDVLELEEKHMDAVTGLNGSGPAFVYVVLEALADGGVMMGLPRDVATRLAARVCEGAARMVLDTGFHPAALKDQVTTPAGCTIAGLLTMEDGRIRSVLARTIQEATRVAGGLGGPPNTKT